MPVVAAHDRPDESAINPGDEEASWELFHHEGIERFLEGSFAGEFEGRLLAKFDECLPESPPWSK